MHKFNEEGYVEALIDAGQIYMAYGTQSPVSVWLAVIQLDGCPPDAALVASEEKPTQSQLWRILPQCEEARVEDGLQECNFTLHALYQTPVGVIKGGQAAKAPRFEVWAPLMNAMIAAILPHIQHKPTPDLREMYRDEHGRVCNVGGLVKEETWQAILNNLGNLCNLTCNEFLTVFSESVDAGQLVRGVAGMSPAERMAASMMHGDILQYRHPDTSMEDFASALQGLQEWYDSSFLKAVNSDKLDRTDVAGSLRTVMDEMVKWLGAALQWDGDTVEHAQDYYMNCIYRLIVQKEKP